MLTFINFSNNSGNLKYNYIYGNGQKLARVDGSGVKEYYHNDYLGSTRRMTDQSGAVLWSRDYYPFGEDRTASGATEFNKFTYEGREKDSETDHFYNWKRYFDEDGRFTQVDPLWQKYPSMSPYVRVANNPLRFVDPTGEVFTTTKEDLEKLMEALPEETYIYLELNNGTLNTEKLAESGSDDEIYKALSELAQSDDIYNFSSGNEFTKILPDGSEKSWPLSFPGYTGVTLEKRVSKTGINEIMISDQLYGEKMVEYIAHEFGHAVLLDRSMTDKTINPWSIIEYDDKVGAHVDKNLMLKNLQRKLIENAISNYRFRHGGKK